MAHVGMKYPVAAPWNGDGTYGKGFVIGKAINFTGTPNKNEVELYADDGVAETDKSLKDMGTSMNVDDMTLKVQSDLLGHHYVEAVEGGSETAKPEEMEIGTDDVAPYFGVGFYKRRRKNNVTTFTVIWLYKVQHGEPTENAETKGDTTNFQTPTIEGKAYPDEVATSDGKKGMSIGKRLVFKTEAEAIAFLNKQAGIEPAAKMALKTAAVAKMKA